MAPQFMQYLVEVCGALCRRLRRARRATIAATKIRTIAPAVISGLMTSGFSSVDRVVVAVPVVAEAVVILVVGVDVT